jgi:hypothetical protein
MPWEEPLQQVLESVQGPVAKIVAVIIIIVTGLTLAFGETAGGFRRLIQIVFGLSIAFAARASSSPSLASAAGPHRILGLGDPVKRLCRVLPIPSRSEALRRTEDQRIVIRIRGKRLIKDEHRLLVTPHQREYGSWSSVLLGNAPAVGLGPLFRPRPAGERIKHLLPHPGVTPTTKTPMQRLSTAIAPGQIHPFTNNRLPNPVRPGSPALPGSSSSIFAHCRSFSS